jgi:hypothetical protein
MSLFVIVANKNRRKVVHLEGGRTSNGTLIQVRDRLAPNDRYFKNQLWVWTGTLFKSFKNPIKCLHLAGGGVGNGTKIMLFDILSNRHPYRLNQEWRIEAANIVSRKNTSACWHLEGGHTGNGTKIQLWNLKNHVNGSWRFRKVGRKSPGRVSFRRRTLCMIVPLKCPGKTVHLVGGRTGNGTKIQLWDRVPLGHDSYDNQLWLWDGTIFRSSKNARKCLHLDGGRTEDGTKIQLWDAVPRPHPNQSWRVYGKDIVSLKRPRACWHLERGHTGNGTKIVLRNERNHNNGAWKVEMVFEAKEEDSPEEQPAVVDEDQKDGRRTSCLIVPLKSPGKTVHLDGGRTGNGTKIQLWDRLPLGNDSYENQLWLWDGAIFRSSKDDRKCLHLAGGNTGNGTKIHLWDVLERSHPNQFWRVEGKNIVSIKNTSACWHLEHGNTGNGTKIQLWNVKNHENGSWRLEMVKDETEPKKDQRKKIRR